MKQPIFICLILLIISPGLGCFKNCDTPVGGYLFVLPHTVSPVQAVYKVGDTISVTADFSHHVMASHGETYLLENFNYSLIFSLYDLLDTNISTVVFGFATCELLMEDDTNLFLDNIGPRGEYNYSMERYRLGFKFRPLKPGFYALRQKSLTNIGAYTGIQKDFPGKCGGKRTLARAVVDVNNGADNNYHLLEDDHVTLYTHQWITNKKNFHEDGVFFMWRSRVHAYLALC